MTRLHPPDLTMVAVPAPGGASAGSTRPQARAGILLRVEPWQVEPGDVLEHLVTPIASLLQSDGRTWMYYDAHGVMIARRPHWSKVTVYRPHVRAVPAVAGSQDWAPPHGIRRPRNGLMVVPS